MTFSALVPTQILALAARIAGATRENPIPSPASVQSQVAFLPSGRLAVISPHYMVVWYDQPKATAHNEFNIPELKTPITIVGQAISPFIDVCYKTGITVKVVEGGWVNLRRSPRAGAGIIETSVRYGTDFVDIDEKLKKDDGPLEVFGADPTYLKLLAEIHQSLAVDAAAVLVSAGARRPIRWDLRDMQDGGRLYATFIVMPMVARE